MANNVTDLGKVGITMKSDWSSSTAYERLDGVMYDGSLWIALANNTNSTPAINNSNWMLSAKHGEFTEQQLEEFKAEVVAESKEEMDDYTDDKKGELDTYTNTKKSDLNTYTGTKQTELNTYTNTKKIDLDNYTNGKKGELDNYTNNLKSDFDSNATSKTAAFNTNASDKTTAFNTNASDKTTAFNANASDKTTAFDSHVTSKTSDFDEHVASETSDFDEHAAEKIEEYDEHIVDFQAQIDDLTTEVEELAGNMPWESIEQTTSISITDAAKYSRNKMELFGNSEQATSLLPEGYTQLEYIESTGTQYINTGIIPSTDLEVNMVIQLTSNATDPQFIYGSKNSVSSTNEGSWNILYNVSSNEKIRLDWLGASTYSTNDTFKLNEDVNIQLSSNATGKGTAKVNGTDYTGNITKVDGTYSITLFSVNRGSGDVVKASLRVKSYSVKRNGTLIQNFIPCINTNNEVGMYDTVTKTFFGNAGTGTFVASAVLPEGYTQLEYIESTGTQYINTRVAGTTTHWDISLQYTQTSSASNIVLSRGSGAGDWFGQHAGKYAVGTSNEYKFTTIAATEKKDVSIDYTQTYIQVTIDGISVARNGNASYNPYYLFAAPTSSTTDFYSVAKLYKATCIKDNQIVMNLVPCVNANNEIGMYDTVGETFYGNEGTGVFIAGDVITKLTPSPEYPSDIHVVKGNNTININDTVYSFNIGNTEFCKVKTNQDYFFKDNGTWYKKQIIEKYVYNNDLATNTTTDTYVMMSTPALNIAADLSQQQLANIAMCNVMESKPVVYTGLNGTTTTKKIRLMLSKQYASDYDEAKALYADKGLTIYYVAETPTNVEITDTTLIETLESIYQLSLAKGTNTITITAEDLAPFMTLNYMQDLPSKLESIESRITLLED